MERTKIAPEITEDIEKIIKLTEEEAERFTTVGKNALDAIEAKIKALDNFGGKKEYGVRMLNITSYFFINSALTKLNGRAEGVMEQLRRRIVEE